MGQPGAGTVRHYGHKEVSKTLSLIAHSSWKQSDAMNGYGYGGVRLEQGEITLN